MNKQTNKYNHTLCIPPPVQFEIIKDNLVIVGTFVYL